MSGSALKGVAVVALTVLGIWGGERMLFPHGDAYLVKAEFKDAGGLTKNSNVKIGGVAAGRISEIELTDSDTAMVTMSLDEGAYPIGPGATAASRPVNLLGEKYVDMDPGDLQRPVPSGTTIPVPRTSRPVELDDVLNVLAPDVRSRLGILINEAGIALGGRGTDFNALIRQLPSALDQTAKLVGSFSADSKRLGDLIDRSDRVLASMAARRADLQDLVANASDTLAVTARKRVELANTVREAPGTLAELRSTMTQLADTSKRVQPFAAQLRDVSPVLTETLSELPSFQAQAQPALAALRTTSPSIAKLGSDTRAPIRRLRTSSAQLDTFVKQLSPLARSFDEHGTKDLLGLMDGWSRTIGKSDGLGHIFGLRIIFDKTLMTSLVDRYVGPSIAQPKTKRGKRPAPIAKLPALKPRKPGKRPVTREPLKGAVDGLVDSVVDALSTVEDSVDSLIGKMKRSPDQGSETNALLNYLVGP